MQASYFDENIEGAVDIGLRIIEAHKQKKIVNTKEDYWGEVDMSLVYGITISCLYKLNRYSEALQLSNKCVQTKHIQYSQYVEYHASILDALGRRDEACRFLNNEYMKGNEEAREMYLEHCR
jgi:tetratricopeptide (TPR) repeat protein